MKIGHYVRTVDFFLGYLKVAFIREDIGYGISYDPVEQTTTKYYWLVYAFSEDPTECTSFEDAMQRLTDLCGKENLALFSQKETIRTDVRDV